MIYYIPARLGPVNIIRRLLDKDALEELMSQWVPVRPEILNMILN